MDDAALTEAADRNLAAAWAALGRNAGLTHRVTSEVTMLASGLPIPFFNAAYVTGPTPDPDRTVQEVADFFAEHEVPFLLWVRGGADDALVAAALAAGLEHVGGPPLQVLDPLLAEPAPPAELRVGVATTGADLQAHRDLVCAAFEMPGEVGGVIIGEGCLEDPDLTIVIGRVDSEPVVTALLVREGATGGIYNVATAPDRRGRGYGTAITWAVVAEAARQGCDHAVLQASEAGYPVYERMGFRTLGRYLQLAGPPTPTAPA